ncbi:hypothetical protein, partial [Salmonella sp. SAL4431]|uniref:hypothetical protein n=1 Tax=Salmonella sp. SAL4431 TaxID=3159886 RepID=UPI00397CAA7D
LQGRLAQLSREALVQLSPYWLDQLARLMPELATQRGVPRLTASLPASGEQEHLWTAVAEALLRPPAPGGEAAGGQARHLLLFIDDLQWP